MNNIRCTIGYDAVEPRQMLVELEDRALNPQEIVDGLLEGRLIRRRADGLGDGSIVQKETGKVVAEIRDDSKLRFDLPRPVDDSTSREFSLASEHCANCGMPVEQQSKDADKCIECTCPLSPVVTKKITVGFVTQVFHGKRCVGQEFTCGDEVTWENAAGDIVDGEDLNYQPYFMVMNHPDGP